MHDLRRSLASWAAMQNTSLLIISKMLGHEDSKSAAIYARLQSDAVRAAMTSATNAMLKLMPTTNAKPN
jgi:hypothetical protein